MVASRDQAQQELAIACVTRFYGHVKEDPIDTHFVIVGALIFFLVMAIFAALGFQP
jgi:hypothetical protein